MAVVCNHVRFMSTLSVVFVAIANLGKADLSCWDAAALEAVSCSCKKIAMPWF